MSIYVSSGIRIKVFPDLRVLIDINLINRQIEGIRLTQKWVDNDSNDQI